MKNLILLIALVFPISLFSQSWKLTSNEYIRDTSGIYTFQDGGIVYLDHNKNEICIRDKFGIKQKPVFKFTGTGYGIHSTLDGGVLLSASTLSKINRDGKLLWSNNLFFDKHDHVVLNLPDGGVLISAPSSVTQIDISGNIGWKRNLNNYVFFDFENNLCYSDSGKIFTIDYQTGKTISARNGKMQGNVKRLRYSSMYLSAPNSWRSKDLVLYNSSFDSLTSIKITGDFFDVVSQPDGFVVGTSGRFSDGKLTKYDYNGTIIWEKTFIESMEGMAVHENGSYTVVFGRGGWIDYRSAIIIRYGSGETGNLNIISGKIFNSTSGCTKDIPAKGVANVLVEMNPGNYFNFADTTGQYEFFADTGINYVVQPVNNKGRLISFNCIQEKSIIFNIKGKDTTGVDFLAKSVFCPDLNIGLGNTRLVRCFNNQINITVSNSGNTTAENVSAVLNLPAPNVIKSSSHNYTNLGNNTFKFTLGNLAAGKSIEIQLQDSVSCNSVLGESFQTRAYAYTTTGCVYPELSSDTAFSNNTIVGSFDPNDKQVFPSAINYKDYNSEKKTVDFTINFQNTGNAEAYKVVVTDTISDKFDFTGFQDNAVSHKAVKRVMSSNPVVIQWIFDKINLAPKTTNEKGSMGYISFSLPIKEGLTNNTKIENRAAIYFDYNDPIITNTASVIISDTVNTEVFILNNQEKFFNANAPENIFSPNPVTNHAIINLPSEINFPVLLKVYNNAGTIVTMKELDGKESVFEKGNIPEGIYHYIISNDKNSFSGNVLIK